MHELVDEAKITIHFVKTQDQSPISEPSTPTSLVTMPASSSSGNWRRKIQKNSVRRDRTRLYGGLEYFSILISFGVFFSFSWTWHKHQRTVHHSLFLFSRIKGLVVLSGIFLLFKFSVWTVHFCMQICIEGEC